MVINSSENKLVKVFKIDSNLAHKLVVAGYTNSRKVKDAKDSDLRKHVSDDDVTKLRARWKEKK